MNKKGWGYLLNATKWHYFVEGKSLCGKWMLLSSSGLEDNNHDSVENCVICRRKLLLK